jgi:hypothetical protein
MSLKALPTFDLMEQLVFDGEHVRIVVLLIYHWNLRPARLLHAIVGALKTCENVSGLSLLTLLEKKLLPSSRSSALPDFLPTILIERSCRSELSNGELSLGVAIERVCTD